MTRPCAAVRDARPEDLPDLMEMWRELREIGSRLERVTPVASEDGVLDRLREVAEDPRSRAVVAEVDGAVAGMAVFTKTPFAPLFDQAAVHVSYLHVRPAFRRRGVARVMLAAAASFADEVGAEHVVTSVMPHLRETNRFYARLGFGPVVVRRSVPVSLLRRRLAAERVASPADSMLARRRTLRRVRAAVARVSD